MTTTSRAVCLNRISMKSIPGDPVEVRLQNEAIDEIVIRRGNVHIEQMSADGWFMGVDASDGSYWQFWFGAKNRKSHVDFRHTETVSADRISEMEAEQERAFQSLREGKCGCHKCLYSRDEIAIHMVLCPTCGNKRCPKASNHELPCTNSNEPGQVGSVYGHPVEGVGK